MKKYTDDEVEKWNSESQEHRFCIESECPYWYWEICECMAFESDVDYIEELCECANLLNYKGYTGNVLYDYEDKEYYGSIFLHDDIVTYSGDTLEELQENFEYAVDDYVSFGNTIGKDVKPKTRKEMLDTYRIIGVDLCHEKI